MEMRVLKTFLLFAMGHLYISLSLAAEGQSSVNVVAERSKKRLLQSGGASGERLLKCHPGADNYSLDLMLGFRFDNLVKNDSPPRLSTSDMERLLDALKTSYSSPRMGYFYSFAAYMQHRCYNILSQLTDKLEDLEAIKKSVKNDYDDTSARLLSVTDLVMKDKNAGWRYSDSLQNNAKVVRVVVNLLNKPIIFPGKCTVDMFNASDGFEKQTYMCVGQNCEPSVEQVAAVSAYRDIIVVNLVDEKNAVALAQLAEEFQNNGGNMILVPSDFSNITSIISSLKIALDKISC